MADDHAPPMTPQQLLAGCAACQGGESLKITFAMRDHPELRLVWHGVVIARQVGPSGALTGVRVKFHPNQRGMVQYGKYKVYSLPHSAATYYAVTVDEVDDDSSDVDASSAHAARSAEEELVTQSAFDSVDPDSWLPFFGKDRTMILVLTERLAREFGVHGDSSERLKAQFKTLETTLAFLGELSDPFESPNATYLLRQLINLIRDQKNAERKVDVEHLRRLAQPLSREDAYSKAEVKLIGAKPQRASGRFCSFCKKPGHTYPYCRQRQQEGEPESKGQGNGRGGAAKRGGK